MTSRTKFNKWKALGEKHLADYLPNEKPGVAGVARGFFYDVWLPLARREGLAHAVALNVSGDLYDAAVEYVRDRRPIGGARALIDEVWRCNMPATEDEFHSKENRGAEHAAVATVAYNTTRIVLHTCGFLAAFKAWCGSLCLSVPAPFTYEACKAFGVGSTAVGNMALVGSQLAALINLPAVFAQILDEHGVTVVLSGYGEPVLDARYDYKKGDAYSDSPAKAAACAALVKQYNVRDYTLIKAVLDRLPWMN